MKLLRDQHKGVGKMYQEIAKLIIYGDLEEEGILYQMGQIFRNFENKDANNAELIKDSYKQIKRLLETRSEEPHV